MPESAALSNGADVDADALIERSRQLAATPLGDRDRLASLLLGGSFLAVAVALATLAHSSRQIGFWTLVVFVVSYALSSRIDFEIGTGSAVPTQLVLVPMLALLPVQYVPLSDIDPAVLESSETTTYCPFKGDASYYSVQTPDGTISDAVGTAAKRAVDEARSVQPA